MSVSVAQGSKMTVAQAAKYLGVSDDLIYIMCREGTLRNYKAGSVRSLKPKIMFRQSWLDDWIDAGGIQPAQEQSSC